MKLVNNWITSEVRASNRNPELNEPGPVPKKKVYPNVRLPQQPGGTSPTEQTQHDPALTKGPAAQTEPEIWDPEERAQKLADYARAIQREKGCDFWTAWILASEQHPELIGSSDGMSKTVEVPAANALPDSGANVVVASYAEIGQVCRPTR